jgi:hypothetical protein
MKYKLSYYEDEYIKLEFKDDKISCHFKNLYKKEYIDHALDVINYINDCLLEMRCSELHGNMKRDK